LEATGCEAGKRIPPVVGATEPAHEQKYAVGRTKFFNLNILLSDQPAVSVRLQDNSQRCSATVGKHKIHQNSYFAGI